MWPRCRREYRTSQTSSSITFVTFYNKRRIKNNINYKFFLTESERIFHIIINCPIACLAICFVFLMFIKKEMPTWFLDRQGAANCVFRLKRMISLEVTPRCQTVGTVDIYNLNIVFVWLSNKIVIILFSRWCFRISIHRRNPSSTHIDKIPAPAIEG